MSISAVSNSGVRQAPEVREAPAARPAEEAAEDRIVPEERAFDRYEPEDKSDTVTCNTDRVDREIEQLKKRRAELEQRLNAETGEGKRRDLERRLAQVERELKQKDNDAYRRRHMQVTRA